MSACVVALGDAWNGLALYGPFLDADAAGSWAEDHAGCLAWDVVRLDEPEPVLSQPSSPVSTGSREDQG